MDKLFCFVAPVVEMGDLGRVIVDRRMAKELRDALDEYLDSFPVLELVECQVCHVYSIGECKHG